ncbi:spondin domain-containing protein [Pelagibaculum spongiae]|uniref:Spondin domain-containing protein n=1 Tax=Pelagibaculum spongiae TaxID=2080658 RepID=A0A2V1GU74_9GAMM|nr:spondin domain-containing protein [Pelagibaculum spongiae]PVZ69636.1 hypothetical protein DC094_10040 [Pelagibaculum spongiae]
MKRFRVGALSLAIVAGLSANVSAAELEIQIENLTNGIYFTPFVAAAHTAETSIFETGIAASASLEALAEGGDIALVHADLTAANASVFPASLAEGSPSTGVTFPAAKTPNVEVSPGVTAPIIQVTSSETNAYLSVAAMLLPTNDAFVGLNSWKIPTEAGTYTINLNAYDAGTEANTELLAVDENSDANLTIPNPSDLVESGRGFRGTGGLNGINGISGSDNNTNIHIHRGSQGDDNLDGGTSDLDSRVHRWLNPVARITVTVK